jgi:hypothetical protein
VKRSYARLAAHSALVLLAIVLDAQQPTPNIVFRFERPIVVTTSGPRRLAIDVPLLAGGNAFRVRSTSPAGADRADRSVMATASNGLSDLRLFDASGKEVPYLLVPNPMVEPTWRAAKALLPVAPVATAKEKTSGFEADFGSLFKIDRFRIDGLSPPYLKRMRLEGSGDRTRWIVLVGEGTVFDLPDSR